MLSKVVLTDRHFFMDNPSFRTLAPFKELESDEMKFVALYADEDSPFRKIADKERRLEVLRLLPMYRDPNSPDDLNKYGQEIIRNINKDIQRAVVAYDRLQPSNTGKAYRTMAKQLEDFRKILDAPMDARKIDTKEVELRIKIYNEMSSMHRKLKEMEKHDPEDIGTLGKIKKESATKRNVVKLREAQGE